MVISMNFQVSLEATKSLEHLRTLPNLWPQGRKDVYARGAQSQLGDSSYLLFIPTSTAFRVREQGIWEPGIDFCGSLVFNQKDILKLPEVESWVQLSKVY